MTMTRRQAIKSTAIAGCALAAAPHLFAADATPGLRFPLPDLPYSFDALEPSVDAMTMEIHHDKHHAGYAANLRKAVADLPGKASAEELIADLASLPAEIRTSVRNNGGGYVNHTLFWQVMAPPGAGGGGDPSGELAAAITRDFGSINAFRDEFSKAAATRFGSGWAWLILRAKDQRLAVMSTANQDSPLMRGVLEEGHLGTPLLGLDVWEHAYYLHYQNRRTDYIANWWKVVNWSEVARRLSLVKG